MNNNIIVSVENDPMDNIGKYLIFGLIYVVVFIVVTNSIANYDSVVNACDISNADGSYASIMVKCNKEKMDYIVRDINRFYNLLYVGIISILIGAYISKAYSNETCKTLGRSLVAGGLGLIAYFILFSSTNVMSQFNKNLALSFTMGVTYAFLYCSILDGSII